jgi:hypothetical protein
MTQAKKEVTTGPWLECPNCEYEWQQSAEAQGIVKTDLCSITCDSDKVKTIVRLCDEFGHRDLEWLIFGRCGVRLARENQRPARWWLQAHLAKGATDWEHDNAFALRLPLVAIEMQMVLGSNVILGALIDGRDPADFRVPPPGYDPIAEGEICKDEHCGRRHPVVDRYLPPENPELLRVVMGRQVEIFIMNNQE